MDRHMFDGLVTAMLVIGGLIGAAIVAIAFTVVPYLYHHIHWVK